MQQIFLINMYLLQLFCWYFILLEASAIQQHPKLRRVLKSRPLEPPFPNGRCGGSVVSISPKNTYEKVEANIGGLLLPPRLIDVWLPPEYDNVSRFPVLYCHDGQNAFEDSSSWTGASWRLVGALTRLKERGLISEIPIVVLLPSASEDFVPGVRRRHLEYGDMGQVFAEAHSDFVANVVKPLVDNKFCTLKGKDHTYAIGTSLGGQASFHLMLRHPELFGGAACLSPAFQPAALATVISTSSQTLRGKRIYLDMGGDMNGRKVPFLDIMDHMTTDHWWNPGFFWLDTQLQASLDAMRMALDLAGVDYAYHKAPGARHNERAWAQRIHLPLLHLYGCEK